MGCCCCIIGPHDATATAHDAIAVAHDATATAHDAAWYAVIASRLPPAAAANDAAWYATTASRLPPAAAAANGIPPAAAANGLPSTATTTLNGLPSTAATYGLPPAATYGLPPAATASRLRDARRRCAHYVRAARHATTTSHLLQRWTTQLRFQRVDASRAPLMQQVQQHAHQLQEAAPLRQMCLQKLWW